MSAEGKGGNQPLYRLLQYPLPGLEKDKHNSSRIIENVVARMTNLTSLIERVSSLLEHLMECYLALFSFAHPPLYALYAAGTAISEYP